MHTKGTLTFAPGILRRTFTVAINDDALDENDETVMLTLSNADNAILGKNNPATLFIIDDDGIPSVRFSTADYTVDEADGKAVIVAWLSNPYWRLFRSVTVDYTTGDGTATANLDYTPVSGTLTFLPGVVERAFPIIILDDRLDEEDETVALTLSNPTNAVLGICPSATLTILDDDAPAIVGLSATNDSPTALGRVTTLTATITAGSDVRYAWAFGDGHSGSGAVVTHTYSSIGVYTAVVTASNGVNGLTAATTVTITPPELPFGFYGYLPLVLSTYP